VVYFLVAVVVEKECLPELLVLVDQVVVVRVLKDQILDQQEQE
tara:strand:- start:34 stop:162 length:129 start_codon:yes stop_codon:yes gene_type:complete